MFRSSTKTAKNASEEVLQCVVGLRECVYALGDKT